MDVLTALVILLLIIVAVDTVLTIGIVRRLRAGGLDEAGSAIGFLPTGFGIDPHRDEARWPAELLTILSDEWLVVLTLAGCSGCETVRRELAAKPLLRTKVCVLVDPTSGSTEDLEEYLQKWDVDLRSIAPAPYELMFSIEGGAPSYPALILAREGKVVETARRVRQVAHLPAVSPAKP